MPDVELLANSTESISDEISSTADFTPSTLTYETETMNNEIPTESMEYPKTTTPAEIVTMTWNNDPDISAVNPESSSTLVRIMTLESSTTNPLTPVGSRATDGSQSVENDTAPVTEIITPIDSIDSNQKTATRSAILQVGQKNNQPVQIITLETAPDIIYETTKLPLKYTQLQYDKMDVADRVSDNFETMSRVSLVAVKGPATGSPTTILMPNNILIMNVTLKTNVSVGMVPGHDINPIRPLPPDIEAIMNITDRKKGEDYEYDYSEPTLPPSLPNVR